MYGQAHLRDRRRGQLPGQGLDLRVHRPVAGTARFARPPPKIRSVHQRRSGHHEPLPARRGLRARRRRRNRPGPGPLRTLHQCPAQPHVQLYDWEDLSFGDREGTTRRIPGQDRAGHPPRHGRNQKRPAPNRGRGRRRRHHGNRRHRWRHREFAFPRSDSSVRPGRGQAELSLHPPHADSIFEGRWRSQNQADAAQRGPPSGDRHSARHSHMPDGARAGQRGRREDRPVLQCGIAGRHRRARQGIHHLRSAKKSAWSTITWTS